MYVIGDISICRRTTTFPIDRLKASLRGAHTSRDPADAGYPPNPSRNQFPGSESGVATFSFAGHGIPTSLPTSPNSEFRPDSNFCAKGDVISCESNSCTRSRRRRSGTISSSSRWTFSCSEPSWPFSSPTSSVRVLFSVRISFASVFSVANLLFRNSASFAHSHRWSRPIQQHHSRIGLIHLPA